MTGLQRCISYTTFGAVCSLCGAGSVARQVHPRRAAEHHGPLPNAYLIARPAECDGVFDFLTIFERPDVAERVRFDGIYVIGNASDSATVESIARAHALRAAVRRASNALGLQRRALGYRGGVLVVTDVDERVLLARPVPSSPAGLTALAQLLATSGT
jgi:hypothetical protein